MNKQDEEKARKIADNCGSTTYNGFVRTKVYSKSDCLKAALEMSAWKEQQMIEKAVKYLDNMLILDDGTTDKFIENFKKYMEVEDD